MSKYNITQYADCSVARLHNRRILINRVVGGFRIMSQYYTGAKSLPCPETDYLSLDRGVQTYTMLMSEEGAFHLASVILAELDRETE